jgi:hypothetical protein
MRVHNLSGGTVMIKRAAIEDIGGLFDERFFMFYEDSDMCLSLERAGYHLYIVPTAKAIHHYQHSLWKLDFMKQSRGIYYEKNFKNNLFAKISRLLPCYHQKNEHIDFGTWDTPPTFSIPEDLTGGYLFEWSFTPVLVPAVGYFGTGDSFAFSREIWNALDNGEYFSRFSDYRRCLFTQKIFVWRKN